MTKRILLLALAALSISGIYAQYAPATQGMVLKYKTEITAPEAKTLEYTETVNSVSTDNGKTTVSSSQNFKATGLETLPEQKLNYTYTTPDAPTVINLIEPESLIETIKEVIRSQAEGVSMAQLQQVMDMIKPSGKLELKLDPNAVEGAKLPASSLRINVGQLMSVGTYISNGKYLGKESVTVPAGTYDCLKVSYIMKENMGTESKKEYVTAWYADGIGLVKEQDADKNGQVTSSTELISVE